MPPLFTLPLSSGPKVCVWQRPSHSPSRSPCAPLVEQVQELELVGEQYADVLRLNRRRSARVVRIAIAEVPVHERPDLLLVPTATAAAIF